MRATGRSWNPSWVDAELAAIAFRQGGVFTHAQALGCGYAHDEVLRRVASGDWVRIRWGVMAEAAVVAAASGAGEDMAMLSTRAVLLRLGNDLIASHESAALAQHLPLLGRPPRLVTVTGSRARPRKAKGYRVYCAALPDEERAEVQGLPVTSAARTVFDIARAKAMAAGLVVADAALRYGACTRADLERTLNRHAHWPGHARAARVIDLADGRSASPGESVTRLFFVEHGLPAPTVGFVVVGADGRTYETDFGWEALRTVGEYDGRVKYESPDRPELGNPLFREKVREDAIRAAGWQFVRVVKEDLRNPQALVARFWAAFERGMREAA